jgi:hypothetical protein
LARPLLRLPAPRWVQRLTGAHVRQRKTDNYLQSVRGRQSYDGKGGAMVVSIDVHGNMWDSVNKVVRIEDVHSIDQEIVAHEWGHALSDEISPISEYDSSVIFEGLADCFAMNVFPNDWTVGNHPDRCAPGFVIPYYPYDAPVHGGRDAKWIPIVDGGYRNCGAAETNVYYNGSRTVGEDRKNKPAFPP